MTVSVTNIEATPNPDALKFIVNQVLIPKGTRSYATREAAANDPLAFALFGHRHVVSVFYMDQFVTVTKNPDASWSMIMGDIKALIEKTDVSGLESVVADTAGPSSGDVLLDKVKDILKVRVLPYLANDGGSLEVLGMEGYQLKIRYQGACGSCPSSSSGTLNAIQAMLRHTVDPKIEVITG